MFFVASARNKTGDRKGFASFYTAQCFEKSGHQKSKNAFYRQPFAYLDRNGERLYRYDGTATDYLRHYNNKAETLPSNNITSIAEDKKGRLWIRWLGGVAQLNAFSLQCKRYRQKEGLLKADFDNKVFVDNEEKLWTGNAGGLELYNAKEDKFIQVWSNEGWKGNKLSAYVTSLCDWKKDSLILGTFADLVLVNKKDFGFRRVALSNVPITILSVAVDPLENFGAVLGVTAVLYLTKIFCVRKTLPGAAVLKPVAFFVTFRR